MSTKKDKTLTTSVSKIPITTTRPTTTTVAAKTSPNENNLLPEAAAIALISVNKETRAAAARDVNDDHQLFFASIRFVVIFAK